MHLSITPVKREPFSRYCAMKSQTACVRTGVNMQGAHGLRVEICFILLGMIHELESILLGDRAYNDLLDEGYYKGLESYTDFKCLLAGRYIEERLRGYFTRFQLKRILQTNEHRIHVRIQHLIKYGYLVKVDRKYRFLQQFQYKTTPKGKGLIRAYLNRLDSYRLSSSSSVSMFDWSVKGYS